MLIEIIWKLIPGTGPISVWLPRHLAQLFFRSAWALLHSVIFKVLTHVSCADLPSLSFRLQLELMTEKSHSLAPQGRKKMTPAIGKEKNTDKKTRS